MPWEAKLSSEVSSLHLKGWNSHLMIFLLQFESLHPTLLQQAGFAGGSHCVTSDLSPCRIAAHTGQSYWCRCDCLQYITLGRCFSLETKWSRVTLRDLTELNELFKSSFEYTAWNFSNKIQTLDLVLPVEVIFPSWSGRTFTREWYQQIKSLRKLIVLHGSL